MKTFLLCIIFGLITGFAVAQPYKSMFGSDSTRWRVLRTSTIGSPIEVNYNVQKDTTVGSLAYKKVVSVYSEYLFREDLDSGKVWYRQLGCDTEDYLYMDYTVQKMDTFRKDWKSLGDTSNIVDSVFMLNGRKHFQLKFFDGILNEHYGYTEGIGWNTGLQYYSQCPSASGDRYTLCVYQDGVQVYTNKYFKGNCSPVKIEDLKKSEFKISPNPATSAFIIKYAYQRPFKLRITNSVGQLVYQKKCSGLNQENVHIGDWISGVYFVCVESEGNSSIQRIIKL